MMTRVYLYLTAVSLVTGIGHIVAAQDISERSCRVDDLPHETLKCQDRENNIVLPENNVVRSGHLCTFTCLQNKRRTWAFCQSGEWNGELEICRDDPVPVVYHPRQRRWGRFFRRVFRAIKCVFSRCHKPRPRDSTPPQLTCPPDMTVDGEPFQNHAKAFWVPPTAWDSRDGAVTVHRSSAYEPGYPISEPGGTVSYYARDKSGNMARCSFRVTINVIRCRPVPQKVSDGYVICHRSDDMVLGTYCRFGCYEGHELIGPSYAKCMSTRLWSTWTVVQPRCQKHSCPDLLPTPMLSISYTNGNLFRSIATFSCPRGYDIPVDKKRVAVCGVDKIWSSIVPSCVDVDPPVFKQFPSSKTFYIPRHGESVAVYWQVPELEDNTGDFIVAQHYSGPVQGDVLPVGTYTVIYKATDNSGNEARPLSFKITVKEIRCFHVYPLPYTSVSCTGNRLGSTCKFECSEGATLNGTSSVTSCEQEGSPPYGAWDWGVQQPFCQLLATCQRPRAPAHGALACDYWLGGRFCQPQCQTGYDIARGETYVDLLVCNDDGSLSWGPPIPDCMPSAPSRGTSRSVVVFYTGSCTDETTKTEIKQNFIEKLSSTAFSHGCDKASSSGCNWQNVEVICGDTNGKRSTGISIYIEITLNSSTPLNEEEYYNQYMEYESLIETLKLDVDSGLLTIQLSDNTTLDAAELAVRDIGLQCEENTVASTKTFTCVECQSGSYYDAMTAAECVLCPVGQYQTDSRQSECVQCPYGTSTATTGSTSLTDCIAACPPGSWSPSSLPPCTPCDVGYYYSGYGATDCAACPGNKITKTDNSSSENDCVEFDVYFPDNQTTGVLFSEVAPVPVMEFTVVWWQQCNSLCTGDVFVLKNVTGGTSIAVTFTSSITASADGHTANGELSPPDDKEWHFFKLKRKHAFLEVYMDGSLMLNLTGIQEQETFGGVIQLGGNSFEGTISQLNIFTESVPLVPEQCSNDVTGDILSWRSILNATMNDAFIQNPSVCDDVKECASSPCNHGNCTDGYRSYECQCDVGYTGSDCDVDIDDCEVNSCQNNATCLDSVNNYTCQCLPTFTGALCEIALVDGGWNEWSNWTTCSVTCGVGISTRVRVCNNPAPDNGGAECPGDGTETEECEDESCPECGELTPPANGSVTCTNDGVDNVCELVCDDGFVTDIPIPDNYTCGNSTFNLWDFKIDTNVYSRLPSCIATTDPDDMWATRTSVYHGLDCDTLHEDTSAWASVMGKLAVVVDSLTCTQNNDCSEDQKFIDTCESRRKRDTSDTASYTVVLHCHSKSKGATSCYEILTQAMIDFERLEEQGEMNVLIDSIEYMINVSQSVADTQLNCPIGMVEVFSFCVPCGPGRYYSDGECALCDIGYYQDTTQQTACKACPKGTTSEGTGSISVTECNIVLPVEDSPISETIILSTGIVAGIVVGVLGVVIFIAVIIIVRLKKQKKKISDSMLFFQSNGRPNGIEREPTVSSEVELSDFDNYSEFPTHADRVGNSKWSSTRRQDDVHFQNGDSPSLSPNGHPAPPLSTRDLCPRLLTPLPGNQSPLLLHGPSMIHTVPVTRNPSLASNIETIDVLPCEDACEDQSYDTVMH